MQVFLGVGAETLKCEIREAIDINFIMKGPNIDAGDSDENTQRFQNLFDLKKIGIMLYSFVT